MKRRQLLLCATLPGLSACRGQFGTRLLNPCRDGLPDELLQHELAKEALKGLDPALNWDGHVHLIGTGDSDSGIWLNPHMRQAWHPKQHLQFKFYLNASCSASDDVDRSFLKRLLQLQGELPAGTKLMLLAFDYCYNEKGERQLQQSAFHTPNNYAAKIAAQHPDEIEWIASIHPYRKDSVEALYQAAKSGARAVKWLPPAMGINPGSALCDPFYRAMRDSGLPLLVHAGEEKAVHGANRQDYGNPLLLRRALSRGVRVIIAHCASLGRSLDIDAGKSANKLENFDLFTRLMLENEHKGLLFGEISAMTQVNRLGKPLDTILQRQDWHERLINASDYPLPAVIPLFSLGKLVKGNYINKEQAVFLAEVREYNAILFDLLLKRMLRSGDMRLQDIVFASRRVFDNSLNSL